MFSPHRSTSCRLSPQLNLAVLGCAELGLSTAHRHLPGTALHLVKVPACCQPRHSSKGSLVGWGAAGDGVDRRYPIQMFPCLQRLLEAHSTWCQRKVLAQRGRSRGLLALWQSTSGKQLVLGAHQDLCCEATCATPSFMDTERPGRALPHADPTERTQTDLETSEYLPTLLVVVQVGGNTGDIDTANLQWNKGKKTAAEPLTVNRWSLSTCRIVSI